MSLPLSVGESSTSGDPFIPPRCRLSADEVVLREIQQGAHRLRDRVAVLEAAMLAFDVPLILRSVVAEMYEAAEELVLRADAVHGAR